MKNKAFDEAKKAWDKAWEAVEKTPESKAFDEVKKAYDEAW